MNVRDYTLLCAVVSVMGCGNPSDSISNNPKSTDIVENQSADEFMQNFDSYLRNGEFPANCEVTESGSLVCNGMVLPNPNAPAEDWHSFDFNGRTYYFQPLAQEPHLARKSEAESGQATTQSGLPDTYRNHLYPTQRTIRFADFHEVFKNESRDESWASAMEAGMNHSIANSSVSGSVVVEYLECRSRMCEIAGYLIDEEIHPTEMLTAFEQSGAWPGKYSKHTSRFTDAGVKRFITIINGYRDEEYQAVFLDQ